MHPINTEIMRDQVDRRPDKPALYYKLYDPDCRQKQLGMNEPCLRADAKNAPPRNLPFRPSSVGYSLGEEHLVSPAW